MSKITLAILIFTTTLQAHAQTCKVEALPDVPRARVITFPDGREIIVIGHNHGDRELPFRLRDLAEASREVTSDQTFEAEIRGLAHRTQVAIQHVTTDVESLRGLLQNRRELKFIGFESTPEITKQNLVEYRRLNMGFIQSLEMRRIAFSLESRGLLQAALGPISYLQINEPQLFLEREILGFESEEATREFDRAGVEVDKLRAELKVVAQHDPQFLGNIQGTDLQLDMSMDDFEPSRDIPRLMLKAERAPIPAAYRDLTIAWIRARLREITAIKQREIDVAAGLVATKQSGVLFMGQRHLAGLMNMLLQHCHRDSKSQVASN